jgi:hypothetical protein
MGKWYLHHNPGSDRNKGPGPLHYGQAMAYWTSASSRMTMPALPMRILQTLTPGNQWRKESLFLYAQVSDQFSPFLAELLDVFA